MLMCFFSWLNGWSCFAHLQTTCHYTLIIVAIKKKQQYASKHPNSYSTFLFLMPRVSEAQIQMAIQKHVMWPLSSSVFVFCAYCCFFPPYAVRVLCHWRLSSNPDEGDPVFVWYMLRSTDTVLMTLITLYLFYCDI